MIVEPDLHHPPLGELEWLDRQRLQCAALDLIEQLAPARAQMPRDAVVQILDAVADGVVQLGKRGRTLRS